MTIVDSHVHVWDRSRFRYDWLTDVPSLDRDFLPVDIDASAGVVSDMIFIQANATPDDGLNEARWVDSLSEEWPALAGIVAFAPVEDGPAVDDHLQALSTIPLVVGVRRLIEGAPDALVASEHFRAGLQAVAARGLPFDACITHDQLDGVLALKRRLPDLKLVLNHLGKPPVRAGFGSAPARRWEKQLRQLADDPTVSVKISGLAPLATGDRPLLPQIGPFLDVALDAFGPGRSMLASDWPVSARLPAATPYEAWFNTVLEHFSLDPDEERLLRADTARAVYRLAAPTPPGGATL